ncbi:MAG: hypothetical protein LR011_03925, partial [Verrucomicrobia bacterium]|nr:hypothetical protein [Verrucomicrobiota bacterium]
EGASRPYSPRSNAEGGAPRRNKSDDKRPEFSASAADSRESFRPPAHNQDASGPMRKKVSRKPSRKRAGEVRQNGQPAMR